MDLDKLPNETLLNILNHLKPIERIAIRRVSKKFNDLVLDDPYWIQQYPILNKEIHLEFMKPILPPWKIWIWAFWYNIAQLYTPPPNPPNSPQKNENMENPTYVIIGTNSICNGKGNTVVGANSIIVGNFCTTVGTFNLIVDDYYTNNGQNCLFHEKMSKEARDFSPGRNCSY